MVLGIQKNMQLKIRHLKIKTHAKIDQKIKKNPFIQILSKNLK